MERVFVVPGIGESTLIDTTPLQTVIWIGIPTILGGYFGAIRLAPNGMDPGPPDGIPLNVSTLVPVYAAEPARYLQYEMRTDGYLVTPYPWDWRKSILVAGDALAATVREFVPEGQQCSMVCHSAGGLVARRAWSDLVSTEDQGRVRRIITIGSPHWGSYYAVEAFSGLDTITAYLISINNKLADALYFVPGPEFYKRWTVRQIADLLLTFPSLYELLPVIGAPDGVTDPNRVDLFLAANWGGGTLPQQRWLDHARTTYRDWVMSPESLPPDDVMTCVSGVGYGTATTLTDLTRLGGPGAIGGYVQGDSVVFPGSALLANSQQITINGQHSNQLIDQTNNGNISLWVRERRQPTPMPPPPISLPAPNLPQVQPFPGLWTGAAINLEGSYRNPTGGDC